MLAKDQPKNPQSKKDGVLLIRLIWIFGYKIHAPIDNGAMMNFISLAGIMKCGLVMETHNPFLELSNGTTTPSKRQTIDILIITPSYKLRIDLTVCSLIHNVDIVSDMT